MTDPIADYLTRLRNAISAKHRVVEVPASNLKKEITKILFDKGYILNYKFVEDGPQGTIKVALKYDAVNKVNAIKKLERVSTPGMRKYTGYKDMPRVINGLGIAIISTSKGVMTDKGYILNFKFVEDGPQGTIKIALKYDLVNKVNAIKKLERVSTPGLRKYTGYKEMPRVLNGLGIAVLSTSKGVMTDKEARDLKIGGEVLCYVY